LARSTGFGRFRPDFDKVILPAGTVASDLRKHRHRR